MWKGTDHRLFLLFAFVLGLYLAPSRMGAQAASGTLGIFASQSDVGSVVPAGTTTYDSARGVYTISAAGANIWSVLDGFHFVWKKVSGDVSLTAEIALPAAAANSNPHRKAVLMFRQSLDPDGVYADVAQHGSGLTALQYRREKGSTTQDIELNIAPPKRVRLEKRGDTITMFLSQNGEPLHRVGASIKLHFDGPFYVGLGLSGHDKDVTEKAAFSNVELKELVPPATAAKKVVYSTLQTIAIDSNSRTAMVVYSARGRFEAPNWTRDGSTLVFNRDGKMWKVRVAGGAPTPIDIGAANDCTGSHGLSPDGKWMAITCVTPEKPGRRVYLVPFAGGTPRVVTENPNSYFHGWSPDGKTILFTRPSHGASNIYSISVDGGPETPLTTGTGISDDPDFSPDGQWIYFNSDRSGAEQIWRMKPDGSQPEQLTFDEMNNWTAHPSPDGKSVVFLSYGKGTTGHLNDKDVCLRILTPSDKQIRVLVNLVGGGGTMNVPNWSPDSKQLAFVSFQMLPEEETGSTE